LTPKEESPKRPETRYLKSAKKGQDPEIGKGPKGTREIKETEDLGN